MNSVEFVQFIPNGFVIYNEAEQKHYARNGTSWEEFGAGTEYMAGNGISIDDENTINLNLSYHIPEGSVFVNTTNEQDILFRASGTAGLISDNRTMPNGIYLRNMDIVNSKYSDVNVTTKSIELTHNTGNLNETYLNINSDGTSFFKGDSLNYVESPALDSPLAIPHKGYIDNLIATGGGLGGSALKAAKYMTVKDLAGYTYTQSTTSDTLSKPKISHNYSFNSDFHAKEDTVYEIGTAYEYPIIIFQTDFNGYYSNPR
jgi:hypothetical protein